MEKPVDFISDLYDYNKRCNGDSKMSKYKSKFFTQLIPSTPKNTDFLIDILEDLLESNTLSQSQKNQLEYILDSSFNQVEILPKKDYLLNIPFSEFFSGNFPSLTQPKTEIN